MAIISPLIDMQAAIFSGYASIIAFLIVLMSCRCAPVRLPESIRKMPAYQKMVQYHCWTWWLFIAAAAVHVVFAAAR